MLTTIDRLQIDASRLVAVCRVAVGHTERPFAQQARIRATQALAPTAAGNDIVRSLAMPPTLRQTMQDESIGRLPAGCAQRGPACLVTRTVVPAIGTASLQA